MKNPTKQEKKLVEFILFLIRELNTYVMLVAFIYKNFSMFEKMLGEIPDRNEKELKLLQYLATNFGVYLKVTQDKDVVEK